MIIKSCSINSFYKMAYQKLKRILVRNTAVFIFIIVQGFLSPLNAAELWLRESLVREHSQEILTSIDAVPINIGERAHPIGEDCDLHVPLRSEAIKVPVLGEIKNACSMPEGVSSTYWTEELQPRENTTVKAEGVFRVWLEHPPAEEGERQCECEELPEYESSNPDHMVELHPLIRLGDTSFLEHVKEIKKGIKQYKGSPGKRLVSTLERKKITIEKETEDGETYIVIRGPKTGYNHWTLEAQIKTRPKKVKDGHYFTVDVLSGTQVVKENLPAFTIEGTEADNEISVAKVGDKATLFGLMRLDLKTILRLVRNAEKEIKMPYEMAVLAVE